MNSALSENQNIEWKESWQDNYLEWVCGFANAQGGKIYVGKNDEGKVIGVKNASELLELIPNKIKSILGIVVDVNILFEESRPFLEIQVSSSTVAISLRGHYYYRTGSVKTELTGLGLNEFLLKKAGKTWDDVIEPRATFEDIDEKTIEIFKREVQKSGRFPDLQPLSTTQVLDKLQLIDNGQLKRAAIILFGKNLNKFFPYTAIKIGRFGPELTDLRFQEIIEGNLITSLDEVIKMLTYKFLIKNITFEGMLRIETLEYPEEALKEILLNALIHGRYQGCTVQIRVYDDRMSVWNDGPLPDDLSLEMLKSHHPSRPRNPFIAGACFKAGLIDSWGRGTIKIIEAAKKANLPPPLIAQHGGGIEVTLYKVAISGDKVAISGDKLSKNENQIIEYLAVNHRILPNEAIDLLGLSPSGVRKILAGMVEREILQAEGLKKGRVYRLRK